MRNLLLVAIVFIPVLGISEDWLGFRGLGGRSNAPMSNPPQKFSSDDGEGVAWRVPTVGRGISGPLVVGDLVFATSCGGIDERDIAVEAFDVATGKLVWRRSLVALGRPFTHPTSANASPTPASDGDKIFALYSSCDLVCLDQTGGLVWYRGLGVDHPKTGSDVSMSSSPLVIGDVVIVQLENQGDSFVAGINKETGVTLWQLNRPRKSNYASPIAVPLAGGREGLALTSSESIAIVDPEAGDVLWERDLTCKTSPSATVAGVTLLVPEEEGLTAFDLSSDEPKVIWESSRLKVRNASPVVSGDRVYLAQGSVLVAGELSSGEIVWQERIKGIGSQWATPVATEAGMYVLDDKGNCALVKDEGDSATVVALSKIDGPILASPAVSGNAIYFRSDKELWKVASE